jgi:hypothetical protein
MLINFQDAGRLVFCQEKILMADDMERKGQQGGQSEQPGQGQHGGQSGQQQPGQQPKKGGQGQYDNEEDQERDRQRRAS